MQPIRESILLFPKIQGILFASDIITWHNHSTTHLLPARGITTAKPICACEDSHIYPGMVAHAPQWSDDKDYTEDQSGWRHQAWARARLCKHYRKQVVCSMLANYIHSLLQSGRPWTCFNNSTL
jgi:hypothetical protein